ncbi:MAG: SHOCT domain-containing protein, partial [Bacteroidota bacterium]
IILGGFGAHRFYLGQRFQGILRFLLFVFFVVAVSTGGGEIFGFFIGMLFLSAVIEGLIFLVMPNERFDAKYNKHHSKVTAPANVNDLKAEGVDYFRSGDYDLALEAFHDALQVRADDPGIHFNLACSYAQLRDLEATLYHLELAVSYGLESPERIEKHPALAWLRRQPAYNSFRENNYRRQQLVELPALPKEEQPLDLPEVPETKGDLLEQLRILGELRERGVITEIEFAREKEKLMR